MKWNETKFHEDQKFRTEKNFIQYCELLLKFWKKFAQLSSIFHGINESLQNSADIWHLFNLILAIFTLKSFRLLQNFEKIMRFYKS